MNERIEDLAKQLAPVATIGNWGRIEWANNVYPQLGDKMYADIDLHKFAESIVRECVKFCEHESNDDDHDEYDMGMWVKAESIKTAIKEHFGVEE